MPASSSEEVNVEVEAVQDREEPDTEEGRTYWGLQEDLFEYDLEALKEYADGRDTIILTNCPAYESESEEPVDEGKGKRRGGAKKRGVNTTQATGKGKKRARGDENDEGDDQPAQEVEVKSASRRTKRAKVSHPEPTKEVKSQVKPKAAGKSKTAKATKSKAEPKVPKPKAAPKPKTTKPAAKGTKRSTATKKRA